MNKKKLLMLVEVAIFVAIGLVLDKLTFTVWAQGGSVSLVMVPIVLMAYRWGFSAGLTTGLLIGILQMAFGGYIFTPVQAFIDYILAFTVVGFAGIVRRPVLASAKGGQKSKLATYLVIGAIIGGLLRYIAHTVAGAIFFAEYAGDQNPWIYSIIYNGTYMLPATILTAIVCALLFTSAPQLLQRQAHN